MKKFLLILLCMVPTMVAPVSVELQDATKKLAQARFQAEVEPEIRALIITKAEEFVITELAKPPTNLGNVKSIHNILSHFNALQAYNLTNEYKQIVEQTIQKAIKDQYHYRYRDTLSYDKYKAIMEQKAVTSLIEFVAKAKLTLENIRERGIVGAAPAYLPPLLGASRLQGKTAQLKTEIRIRSIIERRGEQVMLAELARAGLSNMTSITQALNHFNALQAYQLTQDYKKIIEDVSQKAIAEYHAQEYIRILSDDTFTELLERRITVALTVLPHIRKKTYIQWVKDSLEMIRETSKMPAASAPLHPA